MRASKPPDTATNAARPEISGRMRRCYKVLLRTSEVDHASIARLPMRSFLRRTKQDKLVQTGCCVRCHSCYHNCLGARHCRRIPCIGHPCRSAFSRRSRPSRSCLGGGSRGCDDWRWLAAAGSPVMHPQWRRVGRPGAAALHCRELSTAHAWCPLTPGVARSATGRAPGKQGSLRWVWDQLPAGGRWRGAHLTPSEASPPALSPTTS
jgi:hypothetical protein